MGEEVKEKTYTVSEVIAYTIDILRDVRLPIYEMGAIKQVLSAINNLSECLDALNVTKSQNTAEEKGEVVEDV